MPNSTNASIHMPFHYAFKVKDLVSTRQFYVAIMACQEGRSTDTWVDFDFFGNQLSAHVDSAMQPLQKHQYIGWVDGVNVPIPHFGCVLPAARFAQLAQRFMDAGVTFLIKPTQRYEGQQAQQQTMFVFDYSGNPLEFKSLADEAALFSANT